MNGLLYTWLGRSSIIVAAAVLVGCHSPSVVHTQTVAPPAAAMSAPEPMLITNFCTQTSPNGAWRIEVSKTSVAVSHFPGAELGSGIFPNRIVGNDGTLSIMWTAHPGWLAFIENNSRVWCYDGDRLLWLFTFKIPWRQSWNYGAGPFYGDQATPVPAEVFTRLSEQARKMIQNHG